MNRRCNHLETKEESFLRIEDLDKFRPDGEYLARLRWTFRWVLQKPELGEQAIESSYKKFLVGLELRSSGNAEDPIWTWQRRTKESVVTLKRYKSASNSERVGFTSLELWLADGDQKCNFPRYKENGEMFTWVKWLGNDKTRYQFVASENSPVFTSEDLHRLLKATHQGTNQSLKRKAGDLESWLQSHPDDWEIVAAPHKDHHITLMLGAGMKPRKWRIYLQILRQNGAQRNANGLVYDGDFYVMIELTDGQGEPKNFPVSS